MKLLFAAVLHYPEAFEKWLIPYFRKKCTVYPYDYRVVDSYLDEVARKLDVDKVFVAKGEIIPPAAIEHLRENGIKSACWTIDDHAHPEFYTAKYDVIFTPSPKLIPEYKSKGFDKVYELAFYIDPDYFRAINLADSSTNPLLSTMAEVSFLGTRYDGRETAFSLLRNGNIPVDVFGDQWTIPNKGRLTQYSDCIHLWARSKININIHQTSMRDVGALNTKVYEIPASGGFMVLDYFPEVLERFRSDEVALYDPNDEGSLLKTVKRYLAEPDVRQEVTARAQKRIFEEHTAERRVEQILTHF